jgi:hypothetical protein
MENIYAEACKGLQKLCPRPAPAMLRGARLSHIKDMDPLLFASLTGVSEQEAEYTVEVLSVLFRLHSGSRCYFCGSKKVVGVYELWDYLVDFESRRGVARLSEIAPVCRDCLEVLEYIPGYGGKDGKLWKRVVKRMAKVNKAKKNVVEDVLLSVAHAYKKLNTVAEWSLDLSVLAERGFRSYTYVEQFLKGIVDGKYTIVNGMLRIPAVPSEQRHAIIRQAALEVLNDLCNYRLNSTLIMHKASSYGFNAVGVNIEEYLMTLLERGVCQDPDEMRQLAAIQGAWVFHLSRRDRARFATHMVSYMSEHDDMTWISRVETPKTPGEMVEVHVYSPSFSVEITSRVLDEIVAILRELNMKPPVLVFKPYDPYGKALMELPLYLYSPAATAAATA